MKKLSCLCFILALLMISSFANSDDALVDVNSPSYCYIYFANDEGQDTTIFNIIVNNLGFDSNNLGSGSASARIKFGANFAFRISATLTWPDHQGWFGTDSIFVSPVPGKWRVLLLGNEERNYDPDYDDPNDFLYGVFDWLGYIAGTEGKVYLQRWDLYPRFYDENASEGEQWVSPAAPNHYDNFVTLSVKDIDLSVLSKTYTGGKLTIEFFGL